MLKYIQLIKRNMETKIGGQIKNNKMIEVNQITSIIISYVLILTWMGEKKKRPKCMLSVRNLLSKRRHR